MCFFNTHSCVSAIIAHTKPMHAHLYVIMFLRTVPSVACSTGLMATITMTAYVTFLVMALDRGKSKGRETKIDKGQMGMFIILFSLIFSND